MKEFVKAVHKNGYIKVESNMTPEHLDNVIAQLRKIRHGMEPSRTAPKVHVRQNTREAAQFKSTFPMITESVCFAIVGTQQACDPFYGLLEDGR